MDWATILQFATLFSVVAGFVAVGAWAGTVNAKLAQNAQALERLSQRFDTLSEKTQHVEVSLANLRAELFEKFQPKTHA